LPPATDLQRIAVSSRRFLTASVFPCDPGDTE
jgi:hypothetical protein